MCARALGPLQHLDCLSVCLLTNLQVHHRTSKASFKSKLGACRQAGRSVALPVHTFSLALVEHQFLTSNLLRADSIRHSIWYSEVHRSRRLVSIQIRLAGDQYTRPGQDVSQDAECTRSEAEEEKHFIPGWWKKLDYTSGQQHNCCLQARCLEP